jgi:hypothetical protein
LAWAWAFILDPEFVNLPVLLLFMEADAFIPFADEASAGPWLPFEKPIWFAGLVRRLNCISGTFFGWPCSLNAVRA